MAYSLAILAKIRNQQQKNSEKNAYILKLIPTLTVIALDRKSRANYKLIITDMPKEMCTKMFS